MGMKFLGSVILGYFRITCVSWPKRQLHKPSGLPVVKAWMWDWQRREEVGEAIAGSHVKQVLKYVGCTFSNISAIYLYTGFWR